MIHFSKLEHRNKNNYFPHRTESNLNEEWLYSWEEKKVKTILRQIFPSIVFWMRGYEPPNAFNPDYLYFNFRDPADEAHFLLWSSDGIEL